VLSRNPLLSTKSAAALAMGQPKGLGYPELHTAIEDQTDGTCDVGQMPWRYVDRLHVCARAECYSCDAPYLLDIASGSPSPARFTRGFHQGALRTADRGKVKEKPQVRCDAHFSGVCSPLSVEKHDVRTGLELPECLQKNRALPEREKARYIRKPHFAADGHDLFQNEVRKREHDYCRGCTACAGLHGRVGPGDACDSTGKRPAHKRGKKPELKLSGPRRGDVPSVKSFDSHWKDNRRTLGLLASHGVIEESQQPAEQEAVDEPVYQAQKATPH
jgi:hypothetical protein